MARVGPQRYKRKNTQFILLTFWQWPSGASVGAFFSFVLLSDTVSRLAVREIWLQVIIRVRKYIISRMDTDMWEHFKCSFSLYKIKKKIDVSLCQKQVNKSFRRIPVCSQDRPFLGLTYFIHYSVEFHQGIIFCFYNVLMKFHIYVSNNLARTAVHCRYTAALSSLYVYVYVCMCMCVYAYVYMYVCMCICMCMCVCVCLYVYVYVCICMCMFGMWTKGRLFRSYCGSDSSRPVIDETLVRYWVSPCGICGGRSDNKANSLTGIRVSPVSIIPPMLHTQSFIYHPRCIMFFSQHFSFPCQYHSTNAPYSFIHLPQTLYNVFLPALQFPLSVSFYQCSVLIHSSTTDSV